MQATFSITNFKKLENMEVNFNGGHIYVIAGGNNQGKSSLLQIIEAVITGQNNMKGDKVTHGQESGSAKGEITLDGADGGKYIVKYDFTNETDKFIMIDPDTKVLKSTPRNNIIAQMFKYNSFTIDEFFAWGLTAEGRKKQGNLLLNLLPVTAVEEYIKLDADVSSKVGVKYLKRTELNRDYEKEKTVLLAAKVTDVEWEEISVKGNRLTSEQVDTAIKNFEAQREEALKGGAELDKQKIITFNANLDACDIQIEEVTTSIAELKETIISKENDIKELERQIQVKRDEISKTESTIKEKEIKLEDYNTIKVNTTKERDDLQKVIDAKPANEADPEALKTRIDNGKKKLERIKEIEKKDADYKVKQKAVQDMFAEIEKLNNEIEKGRLRKKAILEENKLPISNMTIEGGEAFYVDKNGELLPFVKDSVSYSEGGMIVFEIMAILNKKLPIWLVGSAESYDNSRIAKFKELAEKHNGIVIMDQVVPDGGELTIKCIEV